MRELRAAVKRDQHALLEAWRPSLARRGYLPSAANLAAYIALRRHDLRPVQADLAALGLSSLGRCENHVMATLEAVINALERMGGVRVARTVRAMDPGQTRLRRHTNALFGPPPAGRWTRFMVTLPTEAAAHYALVRDLVRGGMDCARINCAHDEPAKWGAMIRQVRRAARETGRACRVLMDLAGPKLRTGPLEHDAPILKVKVDRSSAGRLVQPAAIILEAREGAPVPAGRVRPPHPVVMKVALPALEGVRPGDTLRFSDARHRTRRLRVVGRRGNRLHATLGKGAWIGPSLRLVNGKAKALEAACAITPPSVEIRLREGDMLLLTREPLPGAPARKGRPAHISCSEPAIFSALRVGHRVSIDDGRVGAVVEAIDERGAWLHVRQAAPGGERILAEKGLNFPDSELPLPALSVEDLAALDFACGHADLVGYSFVRFPADIDRLAAELARRGRADMGIVAKIETRQAVRHLPEIIVHGAGRHPFGVMIARGDLAVELGYERLAEIQEEILWLCEAAHVPVIWATQVLEGLVKRGRPSRAEISDAALSERAECVMLNKGPFLLRGLAVLENVVARMGAHQRKKTAQFRALHW